VCVIVYGVHYFGLGAYLSHFHLSSNVHKLPSHAPLPQYGLLCCVWLTCSTGMPPSPDFIVPASREAIVEDSAWNAELRDRIPGVLLRALDQLLALPVPPTPAASGAPSAQQQQGGSASTTGSGSTPAAPQDPYLARFNFWLQCLPLRGVAKVREGRHQE
jgi:hypothetical protein